MAVNPSRDGCFTRAGLAFDQHRRQMAPEPPIGGSDFRQLLAHAREALAEHDFALLPAAKFVGPARLPFPPGLREPEREFLRVERLDEVVRGPSANCFDGAGHAALRRHYDDRGRRRKKFVAEQIRPAPIRQIHVDQRRLEGHSAQRLARGLHRRDGRDFRAFLFEESRETLSQHQLILEQQDVQTVERRCGHDANSVMSERDPPPQISGHSARGASRLSGAGLPWQGGRFCRQAVDNLGCAG